MKPLKIYRALLQGRSILDDLEFEPGMCSNGGRYFVRYTLREDGQIWSQSSYEDADRQQRTFTAADRLALCRWMATRWNDEPMFVSGPRFTIEY